MFRKKIKDRYTKSFSKNRNSKKRSATFFDHEKPSSESFQEKLNILKRAFDSLSEGVIVTTADKDNSIIYVNQQFLNETGYSQHEIIGKNPRFLQGPKSDKKVIEKVREAISKKIIFRGEIINYRKDGSTFYNLMTINPVCNEDNEVTHFVGLQSNIDYRIEMENDLNLSNERFNLAVKASKDIIWDWNFLTNKIRWEAPLNELFGYNLDQLETDPEWYFDHIHPDDRENVRKKLYEYISNRQRYWEDEYRYQSNNENYIYTLNRAYIVYDDLNNPVRMIGAIQDLTIYKRLLNEQINLSKELIHSNEDLQQFGYIVSHNLRGSIASIKGLVNVLEIEKFKFPDDIKVILNHLYKVADNLDKTIADLVQILQIRSNFTELKEIVNISDTFLQVKETLSEQIKDSKAEITFDFDEAPKIITIKSYLTNIIYSLISNSIKYRLLKRPLKIFISSYWEDNFLVLEVSDNGMGIDIEKQGDKIFGLYKRFHLHIEGKGMGLYLAKNQAESLGGKIVVSSKVNEGATFKVYFKRDTI
jgi:PAS domain S-box-containing protein